MLSIQDFPFFLKTLTCCEHFPCRENGRTLRLWFNELAQESAASTERACLKSSHVSNIIDTELLGGVDGSLRMNMNTCTSQKQHKQWQASHNGEAEDRELILIQTYQYSGQGSVGADCFLSNGYTRLQTSLFASLNVDRFFFLDVKPWCRVVFGVGASPQRAFLGITYWNVGSVCRQHSNCDRPPLCRPFCKHGVGSI